MRSITLIIGLCLVAHAWAATTGDTYEVSGETVVPAGDPIETTGEQASGTGGNDERAKANAAAQETKPFFCKVSNKCTGATSELAEWSLFTPTDSSLHADCQRACRNPCVALSPRECRASERSCLWSYVQDRKCYLSQSSSVDCTMDTSGAESYVPGYFDPTTGDAVCPAGIPAPGLPEDELSRAECMVVDKVCECDDVYVKFEPSERTCAALMEISVYAQSAFYDEKRQCHLRRCRCAGDAGDASVMENYINNGPEPHVYTFTKVTNEEKKQNPYPCPGGGAPYVPPEDPFYNQFCVYANKKCNLDRSTDIYHLNGASKRGVKVTSVQKCQDHCVNLHETCGGAFTQRIGSKLWCIEQRDEACPAENIVDADPAEESTLVIKIRKDEYPADRVESELSEVCSDIVNKEPTVIPWSALFCGFVSSTCDRPSDVIGTNDQITDVIPCLTACYNQGHACAGTNLDAGGCHLLSSRCDAESEDFDTSASGIYFRRKQEGEECAFPDHVCADKYKYVSVEKVAQVIPALVDVCGTGAKADNTIDNTGCPRKCGGSVDSAGCAFHPTQGCQCTGDQIWSDAHNGCVPPAQCKCQIGNLFFASNIQLLYYSDDCKQQVRCEVPAGGGQTTTVEVANNQDSLCSADRECVDISGIGHCVCSHGLEEVAGSCVSAV